jgi:hypothetical protein
LRRYVAATYYVDMLTEPMNKKPEAYIAPSREGKVNLAIWTDAELRKAVRQAALDMDIGIAEFVETAIREKLAAHLRKRK